jgi:hypothetical protein
MMYHHMPLAYAFSNCTLPRPFLLYIITFHLKRMMNSHTQLTLVIRHEATVCLMWKCRTSHTHADLCQVITTYAIINKWVYTSYISTHLHIIIMKYLNISSKNTPCHFHHWTWELVGDDESTYICWSFEMILLFPWAQLGGVPGVPWYT